MAQLAIKGHETRGKEVIEILEMLGGVNRYSETGNNVAAVYFITNRGNIFSDHQESLYEIISFTLERFLEKYPYKIGDKIYNTVHHKNQTITKLSWDSQENELVYQTDNNEYVYVNYLQPYKEETMETITIDDFKANTKEWLIDKLHDMIISKAIKTIGNIHEELHKTQYPKTYEECCSILNLPHSGLTIDVPLHYSRTLIYLTKLLICRDAYWKIAGEQMGLEKPWEPDWTDETQSKYGLYDILKNSIINSSLFVFPTKEIRDAFYINFIKLLAQCK